MGVIGYQEIGLGIDRVLAFLVVAYGFTIWILMRPTVSILGLQVLLLFLVLFLPGLIFNDTVTQYSRDLTQASGIIDSQVSAFNISSLSKLIQILFGLLFIYFFHIQLGKISPKARFHCVIMGLVIICASVFLDFIPGILSVYEVVKQNPSHPTIIGSTTSLQGITRYSGLTVEPSHLIVFASAGIVLTAHRFLFYKGPFGFIWFFVGALFCLVAVLSFSPSFFLLIMPTVVVYILKTKISWSKLILVTVGLLIAVAFLYTELYSVLLSEYLGKLGLIDPSSDGFSELRYLSFLYSVESAAENLWFGTGIGNFGLTVGLPNLILASTGIIGSLLALKLLMIYLSKVKEVSKTYEHSETYIWSGFTSIAYGLLLMSLVTKGMQMMVHVPYLVFFALPLAGGAYKRIER